jgi:hypothetical protein
MKTASHESYRWKPAVCHGHGSRQLTSPTGSGPSATCRVSSGQSRAKVFEPSLAADYDRRSASDAATKCLSPQRGSRLRTAVSWAAAIAASACLPALGQAPPNDNFVDRFPLGGLTASVDATNTLATRENGEPGHRGQAAANSLWWRWTAPLDGYVMLDTTNSASRTRVAVYDYGKNFSVLNPIPLEAASGIPAINLDHYEFSASSGYDYNIAVDSLGGAKGAIHLDLRVITTPEILIDPADTNVTAGQRATIAVRALGKLPLAYQWQFSTRSPFFGFTNVAGGTAAPLPLGTSGVISKTNEGWYRVLINNSYGAVTSAVARVDVNECAIPNPPQPLVVATNVGKTVFFSASALGTQPFAYQWQFKGAGQADFTDIPDETWDTLMRANISTDDDGQYRFLVSNIACVNQTSTIAVLKVSITNALVLDPNFPVSLTVITNQDASFSVRVKEGYQPISYQWWFSPAPGQTNMLAWETAPDLWLSGIQLNQAGWYWATVSNRYSFQSSPRASLSVETRPPNDMFQNRIPFFANWTNLSVTNKSVMTVKGWNKNATTEPGEPKHQGRGPKLSVWWSFTPPVDGLVSVALTAPDAAQVLAAYTGFSVDQLVPVVNRTNLANQLPWASRLGTVGLWVGLHGESFLEAGMHHLEARFDFELLRGQLKECGVSTMQPAQRQAAGLSFSHLLRREIAYFQTHREHLHYQALAAKGSPIGTGAMESTCGQLQTRVKRTGQFWKPTGLAHMLALKAALQNDDWYALWSRN